VLTVPVLLLFVLAAVVGCAASSWIAFALTVLGVPAALVLLGSLAERAQSPQLTTLTRRLPEPRPPAAARSSAARSSVARSSAARPSAARSSVVQPPVPRMTRAERRAARERAAAAERRRHAAEIERLAAEFGLPNPTYEKFVAEEQARLRRISEALDNPQ
jgi:hypothetical protein